MIHDDDVFELESNAKLTQHTLIADLFQTEEMAMDIQHWLRTADVVLGQNRHHLMFGD